MNEKKIAIGVLLGPTASGKTALGVAVAKRLEAQIISADSMQIYRGMNIGSAKPTVEEQEGIPHHLLDVADIDGPKFNVAQYQRLAAAAIASIHAAGGYPLVVGGTGLYINALTCGLDFSETAGDEGLRAELAEQEKGHPGALYAMLQKEDPDAAQRLHPNDTKRLIRALEVKRLTGKPMCADFEKSAAANIPYAPRLVGLTMPRELLYARIEKRVDRMLAQGLLEETRDIWEKGYDRNLPALQALGYKQLFAYFAGESTLDTAVD
ncbi:MAG: tRNA (adenosine(37)-N6)-dimethylallyltransferase MiaA, partial [Clostridia bacterium]|nr:tRNA (adenosine(37)-N6)-dimethylallyltransferase MiaA [Clostridia bacterium]